MALTGKLISQIDIKSDGDVFHEIFRERPHQISGMSPDHIQNCDLHEGDWGKVGSVIYWDYTHDGEKKVAKEIIEAIDEEKKSVTFKVIEGDLMKVYKTFKLTVHVDTNGEDNLVTWTLEYEKLNEDVPDIHTRSWISALKSLKTLRLTISHPPPLNLITPSTHHVPPKPHNLIN